MRKKERELLPEAGLANVLEERSFCRAEVRKKPVERKGTCSFSFSDADGLKDVHGPAGPVRRDPVHPVQDTEREQRAAATPPRLQGPVLPDDGAQDRAGHRRTVSPQIFSLSSPHTSRRVPNRSLREKPPPADSAEVRLGSRRTLRGCCGMGGRRGSPSRCLVDEYLELYLSRRE